MVISLLTGKLAYFKKLIFGNHYHIVVHVNMLIVSAWVTCNKCLDIAVFQSVILTISLPFDLTKIICGVVQAQ